MIVESKAAIILAGINELAQKCYSQSFICGRYTDLNTGEPKEINDGERIALMHSELSEALEGTRKPGQSEHIPEFTKVEEELADTVIRICDHAVFRKLRLAEAIIAKLAYNMTREDHKLENRKNGGKAF